MRRLVQFVVIGFLFVASISQLSAQAGRDPQPANTSKAGSAENSAKAGETRAPRLPQLTMEQLDPRQKALATEMLKVSSGGLGGPYSILLRSPEMAEIRLRLMRYLRAGTSVPLPLNEFAILIQARLATAQYAWWAHYPLALKAGLPPTVARELGEGKRPNSMSPEQAAVYQFCVELSLTHRVSDDTFNKLRKVFSEQQIVDLIIISGEYVSTAMMLNVAEVGIPNNQPMPLKPMSDADLRAGLLGM